MITPATLYAFTNDALRLCTGNKWSNHITAPLNEKIVAFANAVTGSSDSEVVKRAAADLEGALLIAGSVDLRAMPDIDQLIDRLHNIVEAA
jgi:hypothetical protein